MHDYYSGDGVRWDWVVSVPGRSVAVPSLHGLLLRAGDPDVVVVYLFLGEQDSLDGWSGRLQAVWDRGYHL